MKLKKYRLHEIASAEISTVDKKTKDDEIPTKLCNFVDVYKNWAITKNIVTNFMDATAKNNQIKKFSINRGQVAITKDSETKNDIGISTYIADDLPNVILGYHCALISPDQSLLDGKYLNAFMHTKYMQKYFENNASGSGQRYSLSVDTINNIPVIAPDIVKQREIGNLFSMIDRKIELNRAINQNLSTLVHSLIMAKVRHDA